MSADILNFFHNTQLMWGLILISFSLLSGLFLLGKSKKAGIFPQKKLEKVIQEKKLEKVIETTLDDFIETALENFDEQDKKIFVLALNGVKSKEISKRLNIEENLVKQTVGRVTRTLTNPSLISKKA